MSALSYAEFSSYHAKRDSETPKARTNWKCLTPDMPAICTFFAAQVFALCYVPIKQCLDGQMHVKHVSLHCLCASSCARFAAFAMGSNLLVIDRFSFQTRPLIKSSSSNRGHKEARAKNILQDLFLQILKLIALGGQPVPLQRRLCGSRLLLG